MMNKIFPDCKFYINNLSYKENQRVLFRIISKIKQNLFFMDNFCFYPYFIITKYLLFYIIIIIKIYIIIEKNYIIHF